MKVINPHPFSTPLPSYVEGHSTTTHKDSMQNTSRKHMKHTQHKHVGPRERGGPLRCPQRCVHMHLRICAIFV